MNPCEKTPVVILAGGKGTRLLPYTTALPKPLMPVGPYPILEILLRQLSRQGFRNVTLAVGHLAGLIQAYFRDGREWDLQVTYAYETTPLGTAGPLARTPLSRQSTLVLNGDLLTTLDFGSLVRYHERNRPAATIGAKRRSHKVDFGVIETGDGEIRAFHEKPTLDYLVSIGVYVFSPEVRDFIPQGQHFDFPDLIHALMAAGRRVLSYETDAYWMDIGRPDDYSQANEDFPNMEQEFLRTYVASAAV